MSSDRPQDDGARLTVAGLIEMAESCLRDFGPPLRILTGIPGVPPGDAYQTITTIEGFRWIVLGADAWQALRDAVPTYVDAEAPRRGITGLSLFGVECETWDPRRPQHIALWRALFGQAVTR